MQNTPQRATLFQNHNPQRINTGPKGLALHRAVSAGTLIQADARNPSASLYNRA